jgi:tRNA(adenine34) deaminase
MATPDELWMEEALREAARAQASGEVPIGAVVVRDDKIIGRGWNRPAFECDPTAHAEIMALREAGREIGNYRLNECELFVTLEPCAMCAGALVAARIRTLVFAARDLRFGGVRSKFQIADSPVLNHRVEIIEGVLGAESTAMLQRFFNSRRLNPQ